MSIQLATVPSSAAPRERNLRAVLDALRAAPRRSRAELADQTGLSKPTVASALRALASGGLVRERGRSSGRPGPSASLYEPVAAAALVLGVDIGSHNVRALVADLDGNQKAETRISVERPDAEHVLGAVRSVRSRLAEASVELAVVGSPGIVDPASGRIRSSPNIAGWKEHKPKRC